MSPDLTGSVGIGCKGKKERKTRNEMRSVVPGIQEHIICSTVKESWGTGKCEEQDGSHKRCVVVRSRTKLGRELYRI